MAFGKKIYVLKLSGINSATLEWEDAKHVERRCGSTSYSGGTNLCDTCATSYKPTYEYERDNPSYEEEY